MTAQHMALNHMTACIKSDIMVYIIAMQSKAKQLGVLEDNPLHA